MKLVILLVFSCFVTCIDLANITDSDGATYLVGYDQVTNINQDCYVRKMQNNNSIWKTYMEKSPVDCRGYFATFDFNKDLWAVFSVDGGSNSNYINNLSIEEGAFQNVIFNSYGNGGGPKVSVLVKLNKSNGKISKGTFMRAQLSSGKTNSFEIKNVTFCNDGKVKLFSNSWYSPPASLSNSSKFTAHVDGQSDANKVNGESYFRSYMILSNDLSKLEKSEVKNDVICPISDSTNSDSNSNSNIEISDNFLDNNSSFITHFKIFLMALYLVLTILIVEL